MIKKIDLFKHPFSWVLQKIQSVLYSWMLLRSKTEIFGNYVPLDQTQAVQRFLNPGLSVEGHCCKTGNWIKAGFKAICKKNAVFPAEII